jgi:hypothetical protein
MWRVTWQLLSVRPYLHLSLLPGQYGAAGGVTVERRGGHSAALQGLALFQFSTQSNHLSWETLGALNSV